MIGDLIKTLLSSLPRYRPTRFFFSFFILYNRIIVMIRNVYTTNYAETGVCVYAYIRR